MTDCGKQVCACERTSGSVKGAGRESHVQSCAGLTVCLLCPMLCLRCICEQEKCPFPWQHPFQRLESFMSGVSVPI